MAELSKDNYVKNKNRLQAKNVSQCKYYITTLFRDLVNKNIIYHTQKLSRSKVRLG